MSSIEPRARSGENAKMIFCGDYWDLSEPGGLEAETIATNYTNLH